MNDQPEHDREDTWPAALMRGLQKDAPAPNQELLASLREQSLQIFAEQNIGESSSPVAIPVSTSTSTSLASAPEPMPAVHPQRSPMFALAMRGWTVVAATAAMIALWFNVSDPQPVSGAPFSEVLAQLHGAKSLELRITQEGRTSEVWVRAPGLVRWNDAPGRYRIAAGSRLWQVDEATNTATPGDSPWFAGADQPVDLLKLLATDVADGAPLSGIVPSGRARYDGRDCLVYRGPLPTKQGRLAIEAFVDPGTRQLRGIVARREGADHAAGPPLAELQLLAFNVPLDDAKFAPAKSLTEDGRIGKIADAQGIIGLRPLLSQRWTPVYRETLLKPGDWVRTEIRGANAVRVRFSSEIELTLGPGTLLECISPQQARLHTGQLQINVPRREKDDVQAAFELFAPRSGSETFTMSGKTFLRIGADEQFVKLDRPEAWPKWLAGFEGTAAQESLGSLIVNLPDGRNEPLTVGYHKVSVEIRDQIARTTIEESFVNHTAGRLEGVFHFPLPQDASISGFGMWIGDELVEADVVEKQRAREIYETILRERRDPGLLEWTTGNLFKARVFPIEPRSEKRVKIVYTQVLPLRANQYRYSYGLRSDLLRTKPLRELSLSVTVDSALPLKKVTCPTHAARLQQAEHSAQVEFAAQEYSPERDFELVCEIDGRQSDVVVIPHRRGDDGYLLVQLMPPGVEGNWQREILPEGAPLQLVLLCDTSGSMDSEKRKQQSEFVAAVLSSLGDKDRFLLAATDTATSWLSTEPQAVTADQIAQVQDFLDRRISLGWTDLDQATQSVLQKAPAGANVIYIGDGIVTAGDRDPASFVKLMAKRLAERLAAKKPGEAPSFHTVSVGNTHEAVVLRGIADVGGGSSRAISGERTPQAVALELLNELAQPGWRDLQVEFRGARVAAVYPDRLPNVAAGTQQVLVGRYLPAGKEQTGEVVVTGKRGTEAVRYVAKVRFPDADEGNSFIPRLWARAHLDHLLAQGSSQTIQDEIIGLSEEYHIMTPYTSLLVLETDADRERFGVKRRYEMRDGERFFQQGRDAAAFELAQQQIMRAGDWRLELRHSVLQQLATLGRDARIFQQRDPNLRLGETDGSYLGIGDSAGTTWGFLKSGSGTLVLNSSNSYVGATTVVSGTLTLNGGTLWTDGLGAIDAVSSPPIGEPSETPPPADDGGLRDINGRDGGFGGEFKNELAKELASDADGLLSLNFSSLDIAAATSLGGKLLPGYKPMSGYVDEFNFRRSDLSLGSGGRGNVAARRKSNRSLYDDGADYSSWLSELFPTLTGPPSARPPQEPSSWSPEALAVAKALLRDESLRKIPGGITIESKSETFDPVWNRRASRSGELTLYSPTAWLTKPQVAGANRVVNYCDEKQRGAFSLSLLLGQSRRTVDRDRTVPTLSYQEWAHTPLYATYPAAVVRMEPVGKEQVRLVIAHRNSTYVRKFLIDTAKHVVLETEDSSDGKATYKSQYSDFVEIAGLWWARKIVSTDAEGRKTSEATFDVRALTSEQFAARYQAETALLAKTQVLHHPLPNVSDARRRIADGSATFDDRVVMILHEGVFQQWEELLKHLDAAEKIAADKPGVPRMRTVILGLIRRNEVARQRLLAEARQLAAKPQPDELFLAQFLVGHDQRTSAPLEQLALLELLRPIYERQPEDAQAPSLLRDHFIKVYQNQARNDDSLPLLKAQAESAPWETHRQTAYAQALMTAGRPDEAFAWLDRQLALRNKRLGYDEDSLRTSYVELFRRQANWEKMLAFTTQWIANKPENQTGYEHHLVALIYNNQLDAAYALAERWLKEACVEGKAAPDVHARLNAALRLAQGYLPNLSLDRTDERLHESFAATARFFLRRKEGVEIVRQILNSRFRETEAADQLRAEILFLLQSDAANLSLEQVQLYVELTQSGRLEFAEAVEGRRQMDAAEVPATIWKTIAAQLRTRWDKLQDQADETADASAHQMLEAALVTIYRSRFADTELLPFLRRRIEVGDNDHQIPYRVELFDDLLARPWSEPAEQELFALLTKLTSVPATGARLSVQVPALHRLVDGMLAARQTAARKQLTDQGNVDKLTRTELVRKLTEFRKNAQIGLAERLTTEAAKLAEQKDPLADWLEIELSWLNVQLDKDLDKVATFCRRKLGDAPPKEIDLTENDASPEQIVEQSYDALLRQRALTTLMNLAVRKSAKPAAAAHLLRYIDAGIATGGDDTDAWRFAKYELLIALDRPDDLERDLRDWIRTDAATAPWRQTLAQLLAERGRLDEAIQLFEAAEKLRLLGAGDYRTLADWYLARNRRDDHDRTLPAIFQHVPEYQLSNLIHSTRNRQHRSGDATGDDSDELMLAAFQALLEKAAQPENYLYLLREQYQQNRDFRMLQMLPDSVLGRSQQQIYKFLIAVKERVLYDLRNEAAADEIIARIKKLQAGDRTVTDLRALDLIEAIVERQSAEVLNQKGPHVDACVAALKRAFARKWEEGEPAAMAEYLSALGTLPAPALVDEQLHELKTLREAAPAAGRDRLIITRELCKLLFRSYNRKPEALQTFEAELAAYEQAHQGRLPFEDDVVLDEYVALLSEAGRHAAAEAVLQKHLENPVHEEQRRWLTDRLWHYYNIALERRGEVSLGSGQALFQALLEFGRKQIDAAPDENVRNQRVSELVNTFEVARRLRLTGVDEPLKNFAFEQMPQILKRQMNNYGNTAALPTSLINEVLGPKAALRYVVERMEQWPQAMQFNWNNSWNQIGSRLGEYRWAAEEKKLALDDLEPRVLALVIAELKHDLRTGEGRRREIYYLHHGRFWQEKAKDFAAAAEEVYRERKSSGRGVAYIAEYLRRGLELHPRSVEILLIAHNDGLLDVRDQVRLIEFLHEDKRYAESITLLEPLVRAQPDVMRHRAFLMRAYFHAERRKQLAELVKQTDEHFHKQGRWTDEAIAEFAHAASDCELHKEAVGYFGEAITTRRRRNDVPALNDQTLSVWHQQLAHAHSQLGQTVEAVEAASGAIVCWSSRHEQRRGAVDSLRNALSSSRDLVAYVKHRDAEAARSGQDSPLVRKTIGEVYRDRGDYERAVVQFQIARELQPFDREVCQALIACYDALMRPEESTKQLLAQIDFDRHDLKLYEQLVERLKNDEAEAERAATSLIEAGPNESENHLALAQLREKQNRWKEAMVQWSEVSELRRLEPTGLLGLAAAQIHEQQWDAARSTLDELQQSEWPARFQDDLRKAQALKRQFPNSSK